MLFHEFVSLARPILSGRESSLTIKKNVAYCRDQRLEMWGEIDDFETRFPLTISASHCSKYITGPIDKYTKIKNSGSQISLSINEIRRRFNPINLDVGAEQKAERIPSKSKSNTSMNVDDFIDAIKFSSKFTTAEGDRGLDGVFVELLEDEMHISSINGHIAFTKKIAVESHVGDMGVLPVPASAVQTLAKLKNRLPKNCTIKMGETFEVGGDDLLISFRCFMESRRIGVLNTIKQIFDSLKGVHKFTFNPEKVRDISNLYLGQGNTSLKLQVEDGQIYVEMRSGKSSEVLMVEEPIECKMEGDGITFALAPAYFNIISPRLPESLEVQIDSAISPACFNLPELGERIIIMPIRM